MSFAVDPNEHDLFLLRQRWAPVINRYEFTLPTAVFIPYVGGFADWLPIPYHFVFKRGDRELATNTRRAWKIADTYTIDLSGDSERTLDRRLVLATAVGMDALQAR
jgi:uncharacterized protein YxjI